MNVKFVGPVCCAGALWTSQVFNMKKKRESGSDHKNDTTRCVELLRLFLPLAFYKSVHEGFDQTYRFFSFLSIVQDHIFVALHTITMKFS